MTEAEFKDRVGAVALPPVIYLVALVIGLIADLLWPVPFLPSAVQYLVGIPPIVAGFAIIPFLLPHYLKAGTPYDVRKPATTLITAGAHRFSRNPGYVAITLVYAGAAVFYDNLWMLALLAPVLAVMHFGVVLREERHLAARFGDDYRRYRASVRRWL